MSDASGFQVSGSAAELYERYAVPYVLGPWASQLVERADLNRGERVLDLACGTGVVARLAAPRVGVAGQVIGMDLNEGMLAVARTLPPPPGATIVWMRGDATAIELLDGSIDVILCQQGFQFFPDKLAALREMRRVLAPHGRVLLSVWKSAGPYNTAVGDALERHVDTDTAIKYRANRMVPDQADLRRLIIEAGFHDADVQASTMTIHLPAIERFVLDHLASSPVAGAVAALAPADRAALAADVRSALAQYANGDGVAVPDETNIAVAYTAAARPTQQAPSMSEYLWTHHQFDAMSWHDNHVHALRIAEGMHGAGELVLDLDYILEWVKGSDEKCRFRVLPATLKFLGVTRLRISLDYAKRMAALGPFSIHAIERRLEPRERYDAQVWRILINWPAGEISFEADGFEQRGVGAPVLTERQHLSVAERSRSA